MGNKGAYITLTPPDLKPKFTQFDAVVSGLQSLWCYLKICMYDSLHSFVVISVTFFFMLNHSLKKQSLFKTRVKINFFRWNNNILVTTLSRPAKFTTIVIHAISFIVFLTVNDVISRVGHTAFGLLLNYWKYLFAHIRRSIHQWSRWDTPDLIWSMQVNRQHDTCVLHP